ncbi:MAG: NUDIX domain-containing protein [Nanoarchaeota archaeon]
MRLAICAAIIDKHKVLLVKKKETWILPGGKPEFGETDLECLCREIEQEMPGTEITNISYHQEFQGCAPHTHDQIIARVHRADYISSPFQPAMEINDAQWILYDNINKYNISDPTLKAIESLHAQGFLK